VEGERVAGAHDRACDRARGDRRHPSASCRAAMSGRGDAAASGKVPGCASAIRRRRKYAQAGADTVQGGDEAALTSRSRRWERAVIPWRDTVTAIVARDEQVASADPPPYGGPAESVSVRQSGTYRRSR
jgi:hypothetical protein